MFLYGTQKATILGAQEPDCGAVVPRAAGRGSGFWPLQKYPLSCFGLETESHVSKMALNSLWSQG